MEIVPLPALRDNYIWMIIKEGQCAVIDPGEAAPVQTFLEQRRLALTAIVLTHRHADHVGGVASLLRGWDVPVVGPSSSKMPWVTHVVSDGDQLALPGLSLSFDAMAIPGHTEEHVAYYGHGALFCGDTLFAGGCGRLLGGSAQELYRSLQRISSLPPDTQVYCGHEYTLSNLGFAEAVEPENACIAARKVKCAALRASGLPTLPSLLREELEGNPFLRCSHAPVRAAAEKFSGKACEKEEDVFAALRAWKDVF